MIVGDALFLFSTKTTIISSPSQTMYQFHNGQMSIFDFGQPIGMKLKDTNRWVIKANLIPWKELEEKYAQLFPSKTGTVAKPFRLIYGASIIQAEYGYSDEETVLQIQENPYLQFFCGYQEYDDSKPPFDSSLMVHIRRRLTPEIIGQINELLINKHTKKEDPAEEIITENQEIKEITNKGTLIIDATCAPSYVRYPTDTSLLNEAREHSEQLIDSLHELGQIKPRTYRKKASKAYKSFSRKRKPKKKEIRKAIKQQLSYTRRNIVHIKTMISNGATLTPKQQQQFQTIQNIYNQQHEMYTKRKHQVANRIVSFHQPWLRPIVRGKTGKKIEVGAKLDISVDENNFTRLEYVSFDAYNESTKIPEIVEAHYQRKGYYPKRILVDQIYPTRANRKYCKERGIHLSGKPLGRPKKDSEEQQADKQQYYEEQCERVEVERAFSQLKRKCGLGLITKRLKETTLHCIALSIFVQNLKKVLCALVEWLRKIKKIGQIRRMKFADYTRATA